MLVKLTDIRINGGTQCREVLDQDWVQQFVERMKDGDKFPAVHAKFDGTTYWLYDGFHRYLAWSQIGTKEIEVISEPGTQQDAQVAAMGANGSHGKPRTNADKRIAVQKALEHPLTKDKTNYEIAKICKVSQSFVASIRDPEVKEKQNANRKKNIAKKAKQQAEEEANTSPTSIPGDAPDELELQANQKALEMDLDAMHKLLESDDALKTAYEEIKRLNLIIADQSLRFHGMQNERNELIREVKRLHAENAKLKARK